jgi:hypothetical protein
MSVKLSVVGDAAAVFVSFSVLMLVIVWSITLEVSATAVVLIVESLTAVLNDISGEEEEKESYLFLVADGVV